MKNLMLIAFATLALFMGANVVDACPACEGKKVVKAEKKADKVQVKKTDKAATDVNTDAVADAKEVKTATEVATNVNVKRASAGQLVKADRDCAGTCKGACNGCGSGCGGCAEKGECGGCDKAADCGQGCDKAKKAEKVVKN